MGTLSKKVLITGIEGFTGQHLKKYLEANNFEVFGTSRKPFNQCNIFTVDIADKDIMREVLSQVRPDYIIHLAAISFVGHGNAAEFYNVNVIGTENLLDAIIDSDINPKKVLIASSANVYGNASVELITEQNTCEPVNHYACSKLAMEKIVANYFHCLDIIITRPFNYTGPGQQKHFLIPKIVSHFKLHEKQIELGNLDVSRDYSSINYVTESYCKLLMSNAKSCVINVCSGNSFSLQEIIDEMKTITGQSIDIHVNPDFIRKNDIVKISGDNSKLNANIGEQEPLSLNQLLKTFYK